MIILKMQYVQKGSNTGSDRPDLLFYFFWGGGGRALRQQNV